jgi:hypothetical protein
MATDIDSLIPVHNDRGLGLAIGLKGLRKTWGNPRNFFRCPHFSIVDCVAIALLNITIRLPTLLNSLARTLFASLICSPLIHSPGHGNRLVIPSPTHPLQIPSSHNLGIVSFTQ